MSQTNVRRKAQAAAKEYQIQLRRERDLAERRYGQVGIDIAVALSQRDAAIRQFEAKAAEGLDQLTRIEGLTITAACDWSAGLSPVEAKRLVRTYINSTGSEE